MTHKRGFIQQVTIWATRANEELSQLGWRELGVHTALPMRHWLGLNYFSTYFIQTWLLFLATNNAGDDTIPSFPLLLQHPHPLSQPSSHPTLAGPVLRATIQLPPALPWGHLSTEWSMEGMEHRRAGTFRGFHHFTDGY